MSSEPYWTLSHGHANRTGWSCRECHSVIYQGEPIVIRDGRKLRLMYHERCYSGASDPRSQSGSSYHDQKWVTAQSIQNQAPSIKGHGKWSCSEYGYRGDSYAAAASLRDMRSRPERSSDIKSSSSINKKTRHI